MKRLLLCILGIIPLLLSSQNVHHWESVIQTGDSFKYLILNSDIGTQWIQPDYDESSWIKGLGVVRFGDNDDSTAIEPGKIPVILQDEKWFNNLFIGKGIDNVL